MNALFNLSTRLVLIFVSTPRPYYSWVGKLIVCAHSFITFPVFLLYWPSSFEPLVRSLTSIANFISSSKSDRVNSTLESFSETFLILSTILFFTVYGFLFWFFRNQSFPELGLVFENVISCCALFFTAFGGIYDQ